MVASSKKPKGKITISVWQPVWSRLEKALDVACLKRDAYIGALINRELDHLANEIPVANSEGAQQYIDKQLRALLSDSTPLSLALDVEVVEKLDAVCKQRRIVRDSFFNRLFLFLAFGPRMAGKLLFDSFLTDTTREGTEWTQFVWSECKHDGPFYENVFSPLAGHLDPIWPIRACFDEIEFQDKPDYVDWTDPTTKQTVKMAKWTPDSLLYLPPRFYTTVLNDHTLVKGASRNPQGKPQQQSAYHNLYGLNCYLPDFYIPTHEDFKTAQAASAALLEDFENL